MGKCIQQFEMNAFTISLSKQIGHFLIFLWEIRWHRFWVEGDIAKFANCEIRMCQYAIENCVTYTRMKSIANIATKITFQTNKEKWDANYAFKWIFVLKNLSEANINCMNHHDFIGKFPLWIFQTFVHVNKAYIHTQCFTISSRHDERHCIRRHFWLSHLAIGFFLAIFTIESPQIPGNINDNHKNMVFCVKITCKNILIDSHFGRWRLILH